MEKITWSTSVVTEDMDHCDHIAPGDTSHVKTVYDCCGVSYMYACCSACAAVAQEAEDKEEFECTQCGKVHPKKDMRFWWHYDDNKVEDDPYIWCPSCQGSAAVQAIISKDNALLEEELDMYDEDDDDDWLPGDEVWPDDEEEDEDGPSDEDDLDDILKN